MEVDARQPLYNQVRNGAGESVAHEWLNAKEVKVTLEAPLQNTVQTSQLAKPEEECMHDNQRCNNKIEKETLK